MTVEQVAQNLGASAETLMQEVIIKQTAWHTFYTVVVVLVFLAATVGFIRMAIQDIAFVGALFPIVVIAVAMLIAETHCLLQAAAGADKRLYRNSGLHCAGRFS